MRINYSVRERRWLCWLAGARPVFVCMQASSRPRGLLSLQAQADTVVMEGLGAEGLVERRIRRENMRSKKLPGGFCGAIIAKAASVIVWGTALHSKTRLASVITRPCNCGLSSHAYRLH